MAFQRNIGRAELEVLQYVQDHHPITVGQAAAHFAQVKGYGRTTTLNVMSRLLKKNYLTRRKIGGVYHYSPRQPGGELLRGLVREFVTRTLRGSASPFVAYLAEEAALSGQDLAKLKQLVADLEAQHRKARP